MGREICQVNDAGFLSFSHFESLLHHYLYHVWVAIARQTHCTILVELYLKYCSRVSEIVKSME